jgi:hypothetical protein
VVLPNPLLCSRQVGDSILVACSSNCRYEASAKPPWYKELLPKSYMPLLLINHIEPLATTPHYSLPTPWTTSEPLCSSQACYTLLRLMDMVQTLQKLQSLVHIPLAQHCPVAAYQPQQPSCCMVHVQCSLAFHAWIMYG